MDGLQAVANVRQCAPDDNAHGIVEIGPADFVLDVNRDVVSAAVTASAKRNLTASTVGGRGSCAARLRLRILWICQRLLLCSQETSGCPLGRGNIAGAT